MDRKLPETPRGRGGGAQCAHRGCTAGAVRGIGEEDRGEAGGAERFSRKQPDSQHRTGREPDPLAPEGAQRVAQHRQRGDGQGQGAPGCRGGGHRPGRDRGAGAGQAGLRADGAACPGAA